jgi:hypothetical protein
MSPEEIKQEEINEQESVNNIPDDWLIEKILNEQQPDFWWVY